MAQCITLSLINEEISKAKNLPRKRSMYCLSKKEENMQRMLNTFCKKTYVRPHKHEKPDKLETYAILKGTLAVFFFNDSGEIIETHFLEEKGEKKTIEITAGTWHSVYPVTEFASIYELIDSPYDYLTHKKFAKWSPEESILSKNTPEIKGMIEKYEKQCILISNHK